MNKVYTPADAWKLRKKYLNSICSKTVAEFLSRDKTLSDNEKIRAFELAKKIAEREGSYRVYWKHFKVALKSIRVGGLNGFKQNSNK